MHAIANPPGRGRRGAGPASTTIRAMSTFPQPVIIATRQSMLALWQANHVKDLLARRFGWQVDLLGITTRGDQILDRALSKVGGKGLFVKELEVALEAGEAHLAVHSLKDVPMDLPPGFVLAAVLEREDPRDAFISNHHAGVAELPQGAKVGSSSLRRVVQLQALRPDLDVQPLRGNVDTRLRKLDEGQYDAIVLAAAGLVRLGLAGRIRARCAVTDMLPSAGQGALAFEVRSDATALREALGTLTHAPSWLAVHAERAVSRALGGSCSMPLAALAQWQGHDLRLDALLGDPADLRAPLLRAHAVATLGPGVGVQHTAAAEALGLQVAQQLRDAGGDRILASATAA
jgi:hydroxymethylbilane synthase